MHLREGQVLVHEDGYYEYETIDYLRNFIKDVNLIHYVCMMTRPGVEEFVTKLEFLHYEPLTTRNDLLSIHTLVWNELPWIIISVPLKEKHFSENLLPLCGLRVVDGIPMMFGAGCNEQFPISGNNVFTLENVSGHPVYQNNAKINQTMCTAEAQSVEDTRKGKAKKTN